MRDFLALLTRNRLAAFGLIVMSAVIVLSLITPLLPLADPDVTNTANRFQLPFSDFGLLGTDHLGRDLLSRVLWGTRLSLAVGFSAALIAATIGAAIGVIAGFYGGWLDNLIMRGVDMLMAFPYILLALAIVAALGPGLMNALIAVAVVNIPFFARNIRGITVSIVNKEFIEAARLGGMSNFRIMLSEVFPNVLPTIVIAMSTTVGWMILETAGLSFLGLGSQPPQADLGSMLGEARSALITNPYTSVVPGIMILIVVMAINLLGDGIRDALDPRLKSGALSRPSATTLVLRNKQENLTPTSDLALSLSSISTQFLIKNRTFKAVSDVTLHLRPGECLGIIGESGSGKSVTALSATRLVASPPGLITNGQVWHQGRDLLSVDYESLRQVRGNRISYIFQDPLSTLHPLYTVGKQLSEAILTHQSVDKHVSRQRALDLLHTVRIPNPEKRFDSYPHELSGGMRQRIGIAMALANDPEIIIADEPTTALDVTVQAQILSLLDDLRSEKHISIIFITHDFGVVAQLCDRVAVMYAGQVIEEGVTNQILTQPAHPYTARLMACVPELGKGRRRLEAIPGLPPAVDNLSRGCAFAPRCAKAKSACELSPISSVEFPNGHRVRCLHPENVKTGAAT